MERYKEEWVKNWSVKTIIGQAVSLGMEFMARRDGKEELEYNKKLLMKELYRKINSEEEIKKNIGHLRQYLNERTGDKLITDKELKTFLIS